MFVVVALSSFLWYHMAILYRNELAYWRARLASVADDRADLVSGWLKERQSDSELFATRPTIRSAFRSRMSSRSVPSPIEARADLQEALDDTATIFGYGGIYLLDRDSKVLAQSSDSPALDPTLAQASLEAVRSTKVQIRVLGSSPEVTSIAFMVPIFPQHREPRVDASRQEALGAGILVANASKQLFPMLARDAVTTRTAETLLVRSEGDEVIYFSPLRNVPPGHPNRRFAVSVAPRPALDALGGRPISATARDYGGVVVLSETRQIPLAGWGLIRKIDRDEALHVFRRQMLAEGLAVGFFILSIAGLLIAHRRRALVRQGYLEQERLRAFLDLAPDAIYIFDPASLRILERNKKAAEMDGYDAADLAHLSVLDLHPPEEGHAWLEASTAAGRSTVSYQKMALHYRKKNGEIIPVEESQTKVRVGGQEFIVAIFHDVSDRVRAELKLADSEERYRSVVAALGEGIVLQDESGTIIACNPSAERILGLTVDQMCGRTSIDPLWKSIHEDGSPFPGEMHPAMVTLHTGAPQANTVMGVCKPDGSLTWISINSQPIWGDDRAAPRAVVTSFSDITARRQAQEAVRESEERLRQIAESITQVFHLSDVQSRRVLYISPAYEEIWGRSRQTLYDHPEMWPETVHPEDRARVVEIAHQLHQQGTPADNQYRVVRPDGTIRWVRDRARVLFDPQGHVWRVAGLAEDITDQKLAEEALVKLKKAVDTSGEVIFMTDRQGIITFVNAEFTRLYGYSEAEVVGKMTPRLLKSGNMKPEEYARFWNTILSKQVARVQLVNRTKDGRMVNIEATANPILDEKGDIAGFLAIQRDVTQHLRLEQQFRQAQKMEAVGQLAGGVAHDFNNLLTVINGYSEVLQERMKPDDPHQKFVNEIKKAGDRAAGLTRQLLAFSRQQVLAAQVLDLNKVIAGMHNMLHRIIGEDIELKTVPAAGLGLVKADPGQMEQVLLNLAVNSRDAMPHGGQLTLETANVRVSEGMAAERTPMLPGSYVMLAITDSGVGMDAETQKRVFEPFFTTKEKGKGTGLGLSTVYGIVKQSGGFIWVYSELGHGTTFKVYLPRMDKPAEDIAPAESQSEVPGGTETILFVEDDAGIRKLVCENLGCRGYRVLSAANGPEALAIMHAHQETLHLLLTDLVMPGMSGRALAEQVLERHPNTKILFISGYTDDMVMRHGGISPGTAFLQKPFAPLTLLRKVREVLDAKAQAA